MLKLKPLRIGLADVYGGSMPSGWTRYIFEQFEFPYEVVFPKTMDEGSLASRFDVIVFPSGLIRATGGSTAFQPKADSIPESERAKLGRITKDKTIPQLKRFVESGGAIVTVGTSTSLAALFGLDVKNPLAGLAREKFYAPGSVLRVKVDLTNPLAYGAREEMDVFYDNDPVMQLRDSGVKPVASFGKDSLRSGWAWGQQNLEGTTAIAEATIGEGKLFLLGPEVTFRGQPHGTFRFLFNALYYGTAK